MAIAVPAGLVLHSQAIAYLDCQAARSAVSGLLATLPAANFVAPPEIAGQPATAQQQADLLKTIDAYQRLRSKGEFEGAWELFDPETCAEWSREAWVQSQRQSPDFEVMDMGQGLSMLVFFSKDRRLVDVVTNGDEGMAELALDLSWPQSFILRRTGDDWSIDLDRTSHAAALSSVADQLQRLKGGGMGPGLMGLMMTQFGGSVENTLDPDRVALTDESREITSAVIAGDVAQITMLRKGSVRIAAPLRSSGSSWQIAWDEDFVVIEPGTSLREVAAGGVGAGVGKNACAANLRQLAIAAMMYCQDYDEKFPIADRWCDATFPYVANERLYACPADDGDYSYGMNYKLSRFELSDVWSPSDTVLFFESEPSRKNAWDEGGAMPGDSLAEPARHEGLNNYAWVDGHVSAMGNEEMDLAYYRVVGLEAAPPDEE
jgi:prepilin-type processing-associated H-X9-DG protein